MIVERAAPMVGAKPLLAVGWATVELDRAEQELAYVLLPGTSFQPGPSSEHLGARCRLGWVAPAFVGELAAIVVLLEASTEGRLAATLARHGEGWCATWEATWKNPWEAGADETAEAASRGRLSDSRSGPLGLERLHLGGRVSRPHRLAVEAATIEP
ncbi:MAG: hypothetical protein ABIP77_06390 [Candidatus Limnocylindrales bacterium]